MAYPPSVPPADRTDATVAAGNHAGDHNALAAAIASILTELGSNPAGTYADVTARLEAIAADVAAGGGGTGGGAVDSVNGQTGIVVLDAADVGALTQTDADARYATPTSSTTAATDAVAAHEAKADPHPQYLTPAEGDARYAPTGGGGGGAVSSVNTKTGAVVLNAADVGAIPAGDITLIDVVTQAEYDALVTKVPTTLYVIQG